LQFPGFFGIWRSPAARYPGRRRPGLRSAPMRTAVMTVGGGRARPMCSAARRPVARRRRRRIGFGEAGPCPLGGPRGQCVGLPEPARGTAHRRKVDPGMIYSRPSGIREQEQEGERGADSVVQVMDVAMRHGRSGVGVSFREGERQWGTRFIVTWHSICQVRAASVCSAPRPTGRPGRLPPTVRQTGPGPKD
jgi:hypothetical protein